MSSIERGFLRALAKVGEVQRQVAQAITQIPGWPDIEAVARTATAPVRELAAAVLRMFPWLRRYEWLLEIERLTKINPVLLSFALAFVVWRGLRPTNLGHIGTDLLIYPLLGALSYFNPFLGALSGVAYGVGDLAQKLVWNDIYGATGSRGLNYWGAMVGYVIAYSALVAMGLVPGILARICRLLVRRGMNAFFYRRASASADGAVPADPANAPAYPLVEAAGSLAGAALGGAAVMGQAAPTLEAPAFYLRPDPDVSCHNAEVNTYLKGRAMSAGGGGTAIGGAGVTLATDPGRLGGQAPSDPRPPEDRPADNPHGGGGGNDGGGAPGSTYPYGDILRGGGVLGSRPPMFDFDGDDLDVDESDGEGGGSEAVDAEKAFDDDGRTKVPGKCAAKGHTVPVGFYFCPQCDTPIDKDSFVPDADPSPDSGVAGDSGGTEGAGWTQDQDGEQAAGGGEPETVFCAQCGESKPAGAFFCPSCHSNETGSQIQCPTCGNSLGAGSTSCWSCQSTFQPLQPGDTAAGSTTSPPADAGGATTPPAESETEDGGPQSVTCAQCGQSRPPGPALCPHCHSNESGSLIGCPVCGQSLSAGSTSCWACKQRFQPLQPSVPATGGPAAPPTTPAGAPPDAGTSTPDTGSSNDPDNEAGLGDAFWPLQATEPEIFDPTWEGGEDGPSATGGESAEGSSDSGDGAGADPTAQSGSETGASAESGSDGDLAHDPDVDPADDAQAGSQAGVDMGGEPDAVSEPGGDSTTGSDTDDSSTGTTAGGEGPKHLDDDGRTTVEGSCPKGHRIPVGFYFCPTCGTNVTEETFVPNSPDTSAGGGGSPGGPGTNAPTGGGSSGPGGGSGGGGQPGGTRSGLPTDQVDGGRGEAGDEDGWSGAPGQGGSDGPPTGGRSDGPAGANGGDAGTQSAGPSSGSDATASGDSGTSTGSSDDAGAAGTGDGSQGGNSGATAVGEQGSGGSPDGSSSAAGSSEPGDASARAEGGSGSSAGGVDGSTTGAPGGGADRGGSESSESAGVWSTEESAAGGSAPVESENAGGDAVRDDSASGDDAAQQTSDESPDAEGSDSGISLGGVESGGVATTFDEFAESTNRPLGDGSGTASDVEPNQPVGTVTPSGTPLSGDVDADFRPQGPETGPKDDPASPFTHDGHCKVCGEGPQSGPVCAKCSYSGLGKSKAVSAEQMSAQPPPGPPTGAGLLNHFQSQGINAGSVVDASGEVHVLGPSTGQLPDGVSGVAYQTKEVTLANGDQVTVIDPTKPVRVSRA